jgi:hypothetical protein
VILTTRDTFIWKLNVTPLLLHIKYSSNCGSCTATSPWKSFQWSVNQKNLCTSFVACSRVKVTFTFLQNRSYVILKISRSMPLFCSVTFYVCDAIELNPLNAELNPICHLLALLWAHLILHVSKIRVNELDNCDWLKTNEWPYEWANERKRDRTNGWTSEWPTNRMNGLTGWTIEWIIEKKKYIVPCL